MEKQVLAFDFGASSGRAILGKFDGRKITLTEVHRFDNNPVMVRGVFYWDVLHLFHEIKQGLSKAARLGDFSSIGIDTWGVDFGLLDKDGQLLQNPVHYRDTRTKGLPEEVAKKLAPDTIYGRTGIQVMELNTIFQLYSLAQNHPDLLERAKDLLLMPDLFAYFLTGKKTAEYSIASTTGMLNPNTKQWDTEMLAKLGIPCAMLPKVVDSGTYIGNLSKDICEEFGLGEVRVNSVAGHDTASAIVAVPAKHEHIIYISCGTWSLFGTELNTPIINAKSEKSNITNEGGFGGSIRFLKNISGLWLIQETRRQYRREGKEYSYHDLEVAALEAEPFKFFIDPDDASFVAPGNLPRRIKEYCKKTGQATPETVGEIMRCIYESIAMTYRSAFNEIRECTGIVCYAEIHMVGGGTKDNLLCHMTANSLACRVVAGPIEATALGNIAVQLIAEGAIKDLEEAREVVRNSFVPMIYPYTDTVSWSEAYPRFKGIIGK